MNGVPTLTTERLTLRPWRREDAEYMFDILRRREVTEWLADPSPMASLEQAALRIDARIHFGTATLPGSRAMVPHGVMWAHNWASAGVCLRLGMDDLGERTDPWYGTIEYPTSRLFCTVNPEVDDVEDPVALLERRLASAVFEHATDHPPA